MSEATIPAGRSKGTPLSEATDADINYWISRRESELQTDPDGKFAEPSRRWLAAAKDELRRRGIDPGEQAPQPPRAERPQPPAPLATRATEQLVTATRDTSRINAQLMEMRQNYHLVAPATVCGSLPEGCEVAFALVQVNPDDCYPLSGGKLGLDGTSIKQIGSAAGVSWDDRASGRLDDGSDPHYCHFQAVGYVRNFDGSLRKLTGSVEIDARDGSPQIEEIRTEARNARDRNGNPSPRDPSGQILELRKFLLRHAETKAKLRAIADMGIKRSYERKELSKPFAVARLMWTGYSDDPELRRIFAMKQADAMIGGIAGLYGQQNAPPYQSPAPAPALQAAPPSSPALHAPPRVGAVPRHDDY